MEKKKINKKTVTTVMIVLGIIVFPLIAWKFFDDSKSLHTWIAQLDIEDTSTKVFCNGIELPQKEKAEFINMLKKIPAKNLKKSNTSDETTPDYFFDVTDGKTTYTIMDQVSKGGNAFICGKQSRGKGWYIKDSHIREVMDQIYENIVKQKDKY